MDAFAIHPYMEASEDSPSARHPENTTITIADYPKLVRLLGAGVPGAQRGRLPVYYTEFGVQTAVPPAKRSFYSDLESPARTDSVSFDDPGRLLPARARARLLPADRARACSSSTPSTRPTSAAGSRASTSPTARRSRACRPSSAPSPTCATAGFAAARVRAVAGQYVAYTFFRVDPAWRRLPIDERAAGKDAFAETVEDFAGRMTSLRAYSTTGVRPETDFFLWKITERYEDLGELGAALNATPLAGWLTTPYSYLATTKASEYTKARKPRQVMPKGSPYLVVYPFVKLRSWYALSQEERQRAMDEHMRVGHEFSTIHNHTTYSFGIDDQEFMTVFECDEPSDFMHLMLTLRDSEASRYTERDTPIFVGRHVEIREALDELDGAPVSVAT